jgi:hypothetical protein
VLAAGGACFELHASQAPGHAAGATLGGGLAVAAVCLLVGSAAGTLCNPPLLRHPGVTLLSTLTAVVIALVAGISPAAAALRNTGAGPASGAGPHWPGLLPAAAAACLLAVTWTASALAAARRS